MDFYPQNLYPIESNCVPLCVAISLDTQGVRRIYLLQERNNFRTFGESNPNIFDSCKIRKNQDIAQAIEPLPDRLSARITTGRGSRISKEVGMARLNVEQDAHTRFETLASLLGWNKKLVIGAFVLLWKKTQDLEAVEVNIKQIKL